MRSEAAKAEVRSENVWKDILHPFLFGAFPILFLISNNVELTTVSGAPALLIVSTLVLTGLMLWLLGRLLKDNRRPALLVSFGLLLFYSYGHVFEFAPSAMSELNVDESIGLRHRYLLVAWGLAFGTGTYLLVTKPWELHTATRLLNVTAVALVAIPLINIGGSSLKSNVSNPAQEDLQFSVNGQPSGQARPDIYYLVFDGYASSRTLEELYHYDNSRFVDGLKNRGFFTATESVSNYSITFLSLASSLNMDYLNDLSEEVGVDSVSFHLPEEMIENNRVMRFLMSSGYEFMFLGSGYGVTDGNRFADWDVECGFANEFLGVFVQSTMLRAVEARFNMIKSDELNRRLCVFETLSEIAKIDGPKFIFAHILLPHPPYYFDANGDPVSDLKLDNTDWMPIEGYVDQLQFVNGKIDELVDTILTSSKAPPVIILQADHGPASTFSGEDDWNAPTQKMLQERMGIFNSLHLPDGGDQLLYDSITPVNIFRLVLSFYFGADLPLLQDQSYYSSYFSPYYFQDLTEQLIAQ